MGVDSGFVLIEIDAGWELGFRCRVRLVGCWRGRFVGIRRLGFGFGLVFSVDDDDDWLGWGILGFRYIGM